MDGPVVYVDTSEVVDGRLGELRTAIKDLADFVEANEPDILSYSVYFNPEGTRMTVIHAHRDAATLEFHMKVAGPLFPPFADLLRLQSIDVYGHPGDAVVTQLRDKAQVLGGVVRIHDVHAGFVR